MREAACTMVKVFVTGTKGYHFNSGRAEYLFPSLHLTCRAGAVDDKDLAVSSDQGNAYNCLYTLSWASW